VKHTRGGAGALRCAHGQFSRPCADRHHPPRSAPPRPSTSDPPVRRRPLWQPRHCGGRGRGRRPAATIEGPVWLVYPASAIERDARRSAYEPLRLISIGRSVTASSDRAARVERDIVWSRSASLEHRAAGGSTGTLRAPAATRRVNVELPGGSGAARHRPATVAGTSFGTDNRIHGSGEAGEKRCHTVPDTKKLDRQMGKRRRALGLIDRDLWEARRVLDGVARKIRDARFHVKRTSFALVRRSWISSISRKRSIVSVRT